MKTTKKKPIFYFGVVEPSTMLGRPDVQWSPVKFTRVWAMPNHETFKIKPIADLLKRYVGNGEGWADPFAGNNSPAEWRNDHNPTTSVEYHMEAVEFVKRRLKGAFNGILFDPPYSFRQVSEHYKVLGKKATARDTSMQFYEKVKSAACEKIIEGGLAISFGWNTNGFGRARGFEVIEILIVAHGGSKNDTIVTVERKI